MLINKFAAYPESLKVAGLSSSFSPPCSEAIEILRRAGSKCTSSSPIAKGGDEDAAAPPTPTRRLLLNREIEVAKQVITLMGNAKGHLEKILKLSDLQNPTAQAHCASSNWMRSPEAIRAEQVIELAALRVTHGQILELSKSVSKSLMISAQELLWQNAVRQNPVDRHISREAFDLVHDLHLLNDFCDQMYCHVIGESTTEPSSFESSPSNVRDESTP